MSTCLSKTDLPKTKTLALSETKTQSRSLRSLAATHHNHGLYCRTVEFVRKCVLRGTQHGGGPNPNSKDSKLLDGQARSQVCLRLIGGRCL